MQRTKKSGSETTTVQSNNESLSKDKTEVQSPKNVDDQVVMEFGGPIGALLLIIWSHCTMLYFWMCLEYNNAKLLHPNGVDDIVPFLHRCLGYIYAGAMPNWTAVKIYVGFVLFQAICAMTLPGPVVLGLPLPSGNGKKKQLPYLCNGVASWYVTLVVAAILHFSGVFPLGRVMDNYGPLTTVAMISGNIVSLLVYISAYIFKDQHRVSGNIIYDYFMGIYLNPRILNLDLKIFAEIRIAWILLFFLTLSAAAKQYEELGYVTASMWFMVVAHGLYTNACMKGEECIPTTWDIFYENFGWMLIYWNMAGVPFVYCYQSIYLLKYGPITHSPYYIGTLFVVLFCAYYVWDTANSQKNRFRMKLKGTYIPRYTFPQLPWGTLENPTYIKTKEGGYLLTGGWWGIARKIHYTADLTMALSWGLICGFGSYIPYFYFFFFLSHLIHRVSRDMERCAKKYGEDWVEYTKQVPYIFIPGVF